MIRDFVERRQWGRAGWCRLVSVRRAGLTAERRRVCYPGPQNRFGAEAAGVVPGDGGRGQ